MDRKIKSRQEIAKIAEDLKKSGKRIVAINGSFDIIHYGHAYSLEKAKGLGDVLIVGLNSDRSVMAYKDKRGPIIPESHRARLLAALSCVDYITLFDETTGTEFVRSVKPHIYVNAAKYTAQCVEADAVKEAGGRVVLIEDLSGLSTSNIIKEIITRFGELPRPAIILDRDGTINVDKHYTHRVEDLEFEKNAIEGLKEMARMGFKLVVVTNQSGIGRGLYAEKDMHAFHDALSEELSKHGVRIEAYYFCPHHEDSKIDGYRLKCDCRKPGLAMVEKAKKELNLDLSKSFMIGDKTQDILTGKKAGVKTILVRTGKGGKDKEHDAIPDFIAEDLLAAAKHIRR